MSSYDVQAIRSEFPILQRTVYGKPLIYLDNAATSQTPACVVQAITDMYASYKANVHRGVHTLSQEATEMQEHTRRRVRQFINAGSEQEVIFTRGTTESINLVATSLGSLLEPGDHILLTDMEHHADIVPWQLLATRTGLIIDHAPLTADGSLDMAAFRTMFTPRTRIVGACHVSNVLGTVNPVAEIVAEAHRHGAYALIDGAQAVSHIRVDVQALDCDFYAFSAHKMYGPTGVGVLYGKRRLLERMPPYQGGGEMIGHASFEGTTFAELPFKFEAGTPDFVGIAAFAKAIDWIENLGIESIAAHERELLEYTTEAMLRIPGMRIFGTAPGKAAVISFLIGNEHPYDMGMLLDKLGIALRTGHHCAQPLMHTLGIEGTARISFAAYNTRSEADAFISALTRVSSMLA